MSAFTYQNLRIEGAFHFRTLHYLQIENRRNQHARCYVEGIVEPTTAMSDLDQQLYGSTVTVLDQESNTTLFQGIVVDARVNIKDGYDNLEVQLLSGTYLLDQEPKSRSFQDINLTYEEVIRMVLADTPGANCIMTVGQEQPIGVPLIQYQETDWQFLQRLASHFGAPLTPELTTGQAKLWFGLPDLGSAAAFSETEYTAGVSASYHEQGGRTADLNYADFIYYDVESQDNYPVGSGVGFREQKLAVVEKSGILRDGLIVFTYRLGSRAFQKHRKIYNRKICGVSLGGILLETSGETVMLHLDIDYGRETSTPFPYPWTPISGNLLYLMPKVGTRVSLYFSSQDEKDAFAVHCLRTNGGIDSSEYLFEPKYRLLNTEHGKRFALAPEVLGMATDDEISQMFVLEDDKGVTIKTPQQLALSVAGNVTIEAPVVTLQAQEDIFIAKADAGFKTALAAIDFNKDIDINGVATIYQGYAPRSYESLSGSPVQNQASLASCVVAVLASAPACLSVAAVRT